MRIRFLGTGTSTGVPIIGCTCSVCQSTDPRDKRTRCSALIETKGKILLVDTATEFRLQAVRAGLQHVDAVLYTHAHADHIFGLDDLRSINHRTGRPIPCYGSVATLATIRRTFAYVFDGPTIGGGKPQVDLIAIDGPFRIGEIEIVPVEVLHGLTRVLGFRIGRFAYVTDCKEMPASTRAALHDLDVLVLNALRDTPHPTHLSLDEALAIIADLKPRRAYLTHIGHELSHATTSEQLPDGVELAYDDLAIEVSDG